MVSSGVRQVFLEAANWLAWIAVAALFGVSLIYFTELRDGASALVGARNETVEPHLASFDRNVRVASDRGGHYVVEAEIDGEAVTFMADTGATLVVLTYEDAERIGLDPATLNYSAVTRTANGETRVAPAVLARIRIGDIELRDVEAIVSQPGALHVNLLGMSFLGRLSRFDIEDGELVLTQ